MKTARVLITLKCDRQCPNCCNNYPIVQNAQRVSDPVQFIERFDEVVISGGEPMLLPARVDNLLYFIRRHYKGVRVYLYTNLFRDGWWWVYTRMDGVHFSLHADADAEDILDFERFQELIAGRQGSFRAYIDPAITLPVKLYPSRWSRLDFTPWVDVGACQLPKHEELFIYEPEGDQ